MKHFFNIYTVYNCWNQCRKEFKMFMTRFKMYFCISLFVAFAHAASNLKSWITKSSKRKKIGPQNTHEKKFRTHEKILDPRNIQEKKFQTNKIPTRKKFWTHEIPTRKNFRPTKYPREKILNPRNTQEGTVARWH